MKYELDDLQVEKIEELVQEYGQACIEIGFYDKGTKEYTDAFRRMCFSFGDILVSLRGKEPLERIDDNGS